MPAGVPTDRISAAQSGGQHQHQPHHQTSSAHQGWPTRTRDIRAISLCLHAGVPDRTPANTGGRWRTRTADLPLLVSTPETNTADNHELFLQVRLASRTSTDKGDEQRTRDERAMVPTQRFSPPTTLDRRRTPHHDDTPAATAYEHLKQHKHSRRSRHLPDVRLSIVGSTPAPGREHRFLSRETDVHLETQTSVLAHHLGRELRRRSPIPAVVRSVGRHFGRHRSASNNGSGLR